jgi:SRSO17 transposase
MAACACPDLKHVGAAHQRLTYFTRSAEWSDRDVRREAARYVVSAMTARQPVSAWIINELLGLELVHATADLWLADTLPLSDRK